MAIRLSAPQKCAHGELVLGALLLVSSTARAQGGAPVVPSPAFDVPRPPSVCAIGKDGPQVEKVTFDAAVKRALDRNPTAREAAEEIRRYHALMEEVRASSLPTLNADGDVHAHRREPLVGATPGYR